MSVEIVDGATILDFVEDEGDFHSLVKDRFDSLDTDGDGLLSFAEMAGELMSLRVLETHFGVDGVGLGRDELAQHYHGLFARFDHDGNGAVDMQEFKVEMREMMLAVATGIGFLPVQMVVEEGSFLMRAVEREMALNLAV